MEDEDFFLALQLQQQFNEEASAQTWGDDNGAGYPHSKKRKVGGSGWSGVPRDRAAEPERPLSIVDDSWETLDPNPDVRSLFLQFNSMFFWEKLSGVEVKWSPRMTLCAGVCSYEGRGGLCSIRLSEPLLKLRPRRDLVQTLLHEMIHALLFVTQNNRDRDGHGPEFCKHMDRINNASGTKITVYHSFHDEVDVYRQHWWRCNGPCQNRRPFFGYVKRAMNRPPSARDPWWADHQRSCGGTYTKIKEPEDYGKKGKNEEKRDKSGAKKTADKIKAGSGSQDIRTIVPFSGKGFLLGGGTQTTTSTQIPPKPSPRPAHKPAAATPPIPKPPSSTGVLPKRSVSNHKAFVNINGSPVRITKTNGSLLTPKQRTVQDLFQTKTLNGSVKGSPSSPKPRLTASGPQQGCNTPASASASSPNSAPSFIKNSPSRSAPPNSAGSPFSKYFKRPKTQNSGFGSTNPFKSESGAARLDVTDSNFPECSGEQKMKEQGIPRVPNPTLSGPHGSSGARTAAATPKPLGSPHKSDTTSAARKRSREDSSSANIFDYFQRISQSPTSSSTRAETERKQGADTSTVRTSSNTALTVSCPVCQSSVLEAEINQHLDSCLQP